jgi:hypothetical protein
LRRIRLQFRWENNTLFEKRKIAIVSIKEMTTEKFVRIVKKKNTIFVMCKVNHRRGR